jgi:NADPH:quinone reductase-like Zn-dependent oxidoreductase
MESMMQAVGFRRYGTAEVLEPLEVSVPAVEADTVLIRVAAAGVNPADWRIRNGQFRFGMRIRMPFVPGSDVAGVVEAVGSEVTKFRPGDRVYAMLTAAKGGAYAQFVAAPESDVALVPSTISLGEAAAVPLTALSALQALRDEANLQPGEHILIYGASGGVGTFAVQMAKATGARVAAVCSGRNVELVRSLGADEVLDYTQDDIFAEGSQYDTIFDAANQYSFWRWRRILRPQGTVVTVNPIIGKIMPPFLTQLFGGHLKSFFVQPSGANLETISQWIAEGRVRPVVEKYYPVADAADAHERSESLRARGKLVLVVDEELAGTAVEATPHQEPHLEGALP